MTKALAMVPAFFSPEAASAYRAAFTTSLGPKNVPNSEFYERQSKAMQILAREIRPQTNQLFSSLFK
jgi:hypothetical protein